MKKKKPETLYRIHNLARKVETRGLRRAAGVRKMKLLLGGGILAVSRGRSAVCTESLLIQLRPELKALEAEGRLKVTTMEHLQVDLDTLKVVGDLPPAEPKPNFPDNAVDNHALLKGDRGDKIQPDVNVSAQSEDLDVPTVLKDDMPEGFVEGSDPVAHEPDEPSTVPGTTTSPVDEVAETSPVTGVMEEAPATEVLEAAAAEPEKVSDALVQAIYDSATKKELTEAATVLGLEVGNGNKQDIALQLAMAGYVPPATE